MVQSPILKPMRPFVLWLLAAAAAAVNPARSASAADAAETVLLGGKILTVDARNSVREALAVGNGRIVAVGSDREIKKHIGAGTKVIRLDGKMVIPGVIETHCHAIGVARGTLDQPFVELHSIPEIQAWIRRRATEVPPGQWLRVPRTDITRLKERRHPTPAELDAACTTHPVILNAARKNVLNTLGFKMAGVTKETESVPGGRIIRDAAGNPRMIAGGDSYLRKLRPQRQYTDEETKAALVRVLRRYNEVGITSIFERATNLGGYRTFNALKDHGRLTVRATLTFRQQFRAGSQVEPFTKDLGLKTGDGDDWVRVGPLKITVDGGIHWGSTRLREPYGEKRIRFYVLEDPEYRGDLRYPVELMRDIFSEGHRLGWQMSCHVTGDGGVDRVLDAWEAVSRKTPVRDARFTLIHAYFPVADAVERAKRLGVCVDTQPYLYYRDSDAIAEVYGPSWAERLIGVGDWVRGGVPVAINSDHMSGLDPDHALNSFNPFLMLYIAVSRKNENGRVYGSRQKLSREVALRCVTQTAAHLSFDENKKGSLETGKFADLAVLDRDYLTCPEEEIRRIKVQMTMVDGRIVYKRK